MEDREWEQQWKIINNYWTRLSKISWFVCGEQINICRSQRLSQIIDLHDKQLLFYHSIAEFVLFNEYPWEAKRSAIFKQEWSQEGEKHGFLYACAEYYLQPNTVGWHSHEQTIICRQLFAGHVVGSWPMKRKKNLLQKLNWLTYWLVYWTWLPRIAEQLFDWQPRVETSQMLHQWPKSILIGAELDLG